MGGLPSSMWRCLRVALHYASEKMLVPSVSMHSLHCLSQISITVGVGLPEIYNAVSHFPHHEGWHQRGQRVGTPSCCTLSEAWAVELDHIM